MRKFRAVALGLGLFACGKISVGPIDGHYLITAWACGNTDVQAFLDDNTTVSAVKLTVTNATGTSTAEYDGGCVRTQPFEAAYTADSATFEETAPSCSAACTVECQGYPAATSTFTFERKDTLKLTRILTQGDIDANDLLEAAGCAAGQTETRTLQQQ